jgi:hypothetical protein
MRELSCHIEQRANRDDVDRVQCFCLGFLRFCGAPAENASEEVSLKAVFCAPSHALTASKARRKPLVFIPPLSDKYHPFVRLAARRVFAV